MKLIDNLKVGIIIKVINMVTMATNNCRALPETENVEKKIENWQYFQQYIFNTFCVEHLFVIQKTLFIVL